MKNGLWYLFLLLFSGVVRAQPNTDDTSPDSTAAVFSFADTMPEFVGGEGAMYAFITKEMMYPQDCQDEGKVYIGFVVELDGSVSNVRVLRGINTELGFLLNKEAVRLVKSMPKWKVGKQGNQPVRVAMTLPIQFRYLNRDEIICTHPGGSYPILIEPTLTKAAKMPRYPGGAKAMRKFLRDSIRIPLNCPIEGKIHVGFTVEKDGSLTNIVVRKGFACCEACNEEAVRLIKSMPKWIPGKQDGNVVRVAFILPIPFGLSD